MLTPDTKEEFNSLLQCSLSLMIMVLSGSLLQGREAVYRDDLLWPAVFGDEIAKAVVW